MIILTASSTTILCLLLQHRYLIPPRECFGAWIPLTVFPFFGQHDSRCNEQTMLMRPPLALPMMDKDLRYSPIYFSVRMGWRFGFLSEMQPLAPSEWPNGLPCRSNDQSCCFTCEFGTVFPAWPFDGMSIGPSTGRLVLQEARSWRRYGAGQLSYEGERISISFVGFSVFFYLVLFFTAISLLRLCAGFRFFQVSGWRTVRDNNGNHHRNFGSSQITQRGVRREDGRTKMALSENINRNNFGNWEIWKSCTSVLRESCRIFLCFLESFGLFSEGEIVKIFCQGFIDPDDKGSLH